ncbi:hypothetical protein GCM10007907_24980 [Chitinimonas prasina]|uniref:DUF2726 domain-containing protein n=1 Tax=Chitinimonas prasina TaxID=1434937 RepID=A0ABQ5YGY5_9NEIS|nr:DUF2726 domain-containing protein [Chitinimonas prasina]GLR13708.1 hypothetical protein GCM10007907_24980 [Chitinimonas prasina]
MLYAIALFVVFIVAIGIIAAAKNGLSNAGKTPSHWPYYAKRPLSQPEQVLYYRLIQALPGFVVLPQVGLSRFLGVKKGNNVSEWNNRINRMSVDFLVCDKAMQIVAAIELDDATHTRADRQKADAKKDQVLKSAGIMLLRWPVKGMPDIASIRQQLDPFPPTQPQAIVAPVAEQVQE